MKYALLILSLLLVRPLVAEDPAPPAAQFSDPVALIAAEKFDRPESFAKERQPGTDGWRAGIGKWSIVNGAAYAIQEGPSKNRPNGHEAVCEHLVDLGDLILTGEFKLGSSPQVGFVCRDTHKPNHHLGRVLITPDAIWIQKMSGIAKETRREELKKIEVKTDPNTWHKITLEVCGDRWIARIDDHLLEGTHERFRDRKGRVGMVARGEGAQFRNLSLWSAKPKPLKAAAPADTSTTDEKLSRQMDQAWQVTWARFYLPQVHTFADYLSSYEKGKEQAHLPTAEEVRRQYPNPCGYSTGMEDGAILGGAMLSVLCDRFAVTGEESLRDQAAQVFNGLRLCATVHGVPGFVARNVCPEDRKSVYINSSRDQVTHFVHGLWQYYQSPLAGESQRTEIRKILADVAGRMIAFVTPENDFDFCRADGTRCPLGICRMWNVQPHEAARLPMIYAAAWNVTREDRFHAQWRKYVAEAIEQSANPGEHKPAYALLQMQCSLELLHHLEPDPALKATIHARMLHVRDLAVRRFTSVLGSLAKKTPEQMQMLGPDWRHVAVWKDQKGYPNPQWGPYREIWHLTREAGESALVLLMADPETASESQRSTLRHMLGGFDYLHNSSCGIIYHLAAHWKARRHGVLTTAP